MSPKPLDFHELRPDPKGRRERIFEDRHPIALLLDRLEDPRNAGALFRLADAARLAHIYGYQTGDLPSLKKVQRVARATPQYVPFSGLEKLEEVEKLRSAFTLVGLDTTAESVPFFDYSPKRPTLLLVGNEVEGLRPNLLALAEVCVHVPMYGMNTSMNVAMATAIVVYGWLPALRS